MDDAQKIQKAVIFFRESLPGLQAVYGFGSRFDGSARPDSDWDFAFLAEKPLSENLIFEISVKSAEKIDTDKLDFIDIRRATPFFRFQIILTGRRIYCPESFPADLYECSAMTQYQFFHQQTENIAQAWIESYFTKVNE